MTLAATACVYGQETGLWNVCLLVAGVCSNGKIQVVIFRLCVIDR